MDPGDLDLLDLKHPGQYYIDGSLAFGFTHESRFFPEILRCNPLYHETNGFPDLHNYIYNLIYT